MTVTASDIRHSGPWTVDDLANLPDDGNRYELIEGSLLVSPAPALPHLRVVTHLRRLLERHMPRDVEVGEGAGVLRSLQTYFIPDIFAVSAEAFERDGAGFRAEDMLLAVEVLSPQGKSLDLITKRYHYATMGIPQYWIVDPKARTLTVLTLDGKNYREDVVKAGQRWHTEYPFPLDLDPGEFC